MGCIHNKANVCEYSDDLNIRICYSEECDLFEEEFEECVYCEDGRCQVPYVFELKNKPCHSQNFNDCSLYESGEDIMKREKSDSITHLVKIVATEIFDEMFEKKLKECFPCTEPNTLNAGSVWLKVEDELLKLEIDSAISKIAVTHNRSVSSIHHRLRLKDLI